MALINVTGAAQDAQDGRIYSNPERVGNRRWGQRVFLTGTEAVIPVENLVIEWNNFESVTVSTTALALTENLAELSSEAFITVESQAVRYRIDGQVPTASVGHVVEAGGVIELSGYWELDKFRVIRRDATDATLRVTYGVRRDQ